MAGRMIFCVAIAVFIFAVNCENERVPANDVAKQTGICRYCLCKDGKVDCQDKNLTTFFSKDLWADLTEYKPTHVDLSDNFFTNVTLMAELPIEVLNLSRSKIETIENASFKDLQDLRVLDLSHNKLTAAKLSPHAFEGRYSPEKYEPLQSMRVLNLANNDLHSLNQDLFEHLPELTELDLSGNPLAVIDRVTLIAIDSLPMLQVLRLRECQIPEVPDKFLHTLRHLQRLDLSNNELKAIPQELQEAKNLVFLNLNQNPILILDADDEKYPGFPRLRKLQELHMCNLKSLRSIGAGTLGGLEGLTKLHLSFNPKLSYIDPKALARPDDIGETYDWPPVKELYLQSNNLTEVDSRMLSRWDLVEALDVSDNPFLCDCSTQWMVDFLVPVVERTSRNSSLMVCHHPIEMKGYTMKHLHDTHRTMRCVDKYGNRPERDGAILMGTLIESPPLDKDEDLPRYDGYGEDPSQYDGEDLSSYADKTPSRYIGEDTSSYDDVDQPSYKVPPSPSYDDVDPPSYKVPPSPSYDGVDPPSNYGKDPSRYNSEVPSLYVSQKTYRNYGEDPSRYNGEVKSRCDDEETSWHEGKKASRYDGEDPSLEGMYTNVKMHDRITNFNDMYHFSSMFVLGLVFVFVLWASQVYRIERAREISAATAAKSTDDTATQEMQTLKDDIAPAESQALSEDPSMEDPNSVQCSIHYSEVSELVRESESNVSVKNKCTESADYCGSAGVSVIELHSPLSRK